MSRRIIFLLIAGIASFSSCTSNEVGSSKDVNPDAIWFDYKVWGEEGSDDVTVMLQYRFAGSNGTTILLDEPSKVELDGEELKADSSKMTGAFYEKRMPLADFSGKHSIVFTDQDKKMYREDFGFQPFILKTVLPDTISRNDLVFELEGLAAEDYVRVILTDTVFGSNGIHRLDTVKNGKIYISKEELSELASGPIHMEFYKEDDRPVKKGTREGGVILITYGLKREFVLQDEPEKE